MAAGEKKMLRFQAGEIGYVFYEEAPGFGSIGRTYAFGSIGDAAAWLVTRFPEAVADEISSTDPVYPAPENPELRIDQLAKDIVRRDDAINMRFAALSTAFSAADQALASRIDTLTVSD